MTRYISIVVLTLPLVSGIALAENPTAPGRVNPKVLDDCAKRITKKTIHEGMTKAQVSKAWGIPLKSFIYPKPTETNNNFGSGPIRYVPVTEVWDFKIDSVYFNGNVVTSIRDGKYDACYESALRSGRIFLK